MCVDQVRMRNRQCLMIFSLVEIILSCHQRNEEIKLMMENLINLNYNLYHKLHG